MVRQEDKTTFSIQSLEEVKQFDSLFDRYAAARTHSSGDPVTKDYLTLLYLHCQKHCATGRLFNAVVDLEFTYLFMHMDVGKCAGIWNERFSPKHPQIDSVLQDFHKFSGKMDILCSFNSFAFRCRSFWDKYLGILILLYDEEKYDQYFKGQSRKKTFKKIANEWSEISPHIRKSLSKIVVDQNREKGENATLKRELSNLDIAFPSPFIEMLLELIEGLDTVRTAEAHGTGMLRKWSLSTLPLERTRDFGLINHWNIANDFMKALRKTLLDHVHVGLHADSLPT